MALTLLSIQEAAERYHTSLEQLRTMVDDGRITPVAINGHVLLDDEEVRKVTGQNGSVLHWISLQEASARYSLDQDLLDRLARDGIVRSQVWDGEQFLVIEDVTPIAARLDKANFEHLEEKPIEMARAVEQYGFSFQALLNWVKRGHIRTVQDGHRPILLNEADVAYTKVLAELRGISAASTASTPSCPSWVSAGPGAFRTRPAERPLPCRLT